MKIALIGCDGFVGLYIKKYLLMTNNENYFFNRNNYHENINYSFDVVINAAMPSKRFWAKNNPDLDYVETVEKTIKIVNNWKFKKIIHISTVSARCQLDTVYGLNKLKSEQVCTKAFEHLIIRLGPMYGENLTKGVLIDMIKNQEVFVDGQSKYSFTKIDWIGEWIVRNLDKKGTYEIGANDYIKLSDLAKKLNSKSKFSGSLDDQIILNCRDYPGSSIDVVTFLNSNIL